MKANLYRTLSAVLLSSILLTFTACSKNTNETKRNIPESSSSVSETVSENTVDESSEDKSALTSEKEKTSSGPSSEKSEEKSKEKTESSKTTSEKTTTDEAEQALKDYEASMQKEGVIEGVFPEDSSDKAVWKVNKTKIDDFNNDGQPELIIQYYCGYSATSYRDAIEKQGIAIGIARYKDGSVQEYRSSNDLKYYLRFAGADISTVDSEITEEPYIDDNGNIGVLLSRYNINGDTVGLIYATYTLGDNGFENNGGFSIRQVYMTGHYGLNREPKDRNYWFFVSPDNSFDRAMLFDYVDNAFDFQLLDGSPAQPEDIREKFDNIKSLNKIEEFKISSGSIPLSIQDDFYKLTLGEFYMP